MKKYNFAIIGVTLLLSLSACNDWLDIDPSDQVSSEKLFESGDGFRNALNGIYIAMSSSELYGRELSWGLASVLSQTYADNDIAKSKAYGSAMEYEYGETEIKAVLESVWSKGYNVIANCNKLISEAEAKDSTAFREGALERNLFTVYPSKYEPNLSTKEILKKVEEDLLEARQLVAKHDTIVNTSTMAMPDYRMGGTNKATGGDFFGQRGIRMNYVAINALLARVYLYDNDWNNAAKYAKHVIDDFVTRRKWFYFTDPYDYAKATDKYKYVKLYEDTFLAFYDRELLERIDNFKSANNSLLMTLKNYDALFELDADDYRTSLATSDGKTGKTSMKWINTNSTNQSVTIQYKLIPMIRLSEMYYILSEASSKTSLSEALSYLSVVRKARGAKRDISGTASKDYYNELVAEYKKEFLAEGQMFYFFKRWNMPVTTGTQVIQMDGRYVMPIPESEIIY